MVLPEIIPYSLHKLIPIFLTSTTILRLYTTCIAHLYEPIIFPRTTIWSQTITCTPLIHLLFLTRTPACLGSTYKLISISHTKWYSLHSQTPPLRAHRAVFPLYTDLRVSGLSKWYLFRCLRRSCSEVLMQVWIFETTADPIRAEDEGFSAARKPITGLVHRSVLLSSLLLFIYSFTVTC